MSPRWTVRPEGSTWGDFGPDDFLGRLNLLTPARVRRGAAEIRDGLSLPLSLPLDLPGGSVLNPNRHPPVLRPNLRRGRVNMNCVMSEFDPHTTDVLSDDLVLLYTQYSTQWDSLAHVGSVFDVDGSGRPVAVYYNGFRAGVDVVGPESVDGAGPPGPGDGSTSSAGRLGIDSMAGHGVQGRGVLIDLERHLGEQRVTVTHDVLEDILDRDGITVEAGDVVLFHTGFATRLMEMDGRPDPDVLAAAGAALDGKDTRLQEWITDSGIAAIAADNYAVEDHPAAGSLPPSSMLPLHEHCLFRLGVPLGELWYLDGLATALAERGRSHFFLTAPPLRLPGAVGSPLTPVATL
ncbi:cyclase family protein [Nocardiopsis salina]|uniref:cyclase family protein n=1 Tax=Nocardiopsis salina TaxID=245836 RepID=UPI00034DA5AD|nr:cyclase family protein [Nocardiopsis salina]